jgi:hypothetical protein
VPLSQAGEGARLFVVVTWGASGSLWLARLLNAHPEVLCLHAFNGQLNRHWGQSIDELTYLRAIAHQSKAYRLAGDVHGVDVHGLGALRDAFGDRLRVATLVRHPVPRLVSQWAVYRRRGIGLRELSRRARWRARLRVWRRAGNPDEPLFAHAMSLVNRVVLESRQGPMFALERLASDVDEAQALLSHLSASELAFPESAFESVWRTRVNPHASAEARVFEPKALFAELPAWQREAFAALLDPAARSRYEELGYDLSFV